MKETRIDFKDQGNRRSRRKSNLYFKNYLLNESRTKKDQKQKQLYQDENFDYGF